MKEEQIKKLLVYWYTENDKVIPMSLSDIKTLLKDIGCEDINALNYLRLQKNYIDLLPSNEFVLTNTGKLIREKLLPHIKKRGLITTSKNWSNFKKLVAYYLECIKHEERAQDYIKPEKIGSEYIIPSSLDYGWLEAPSDSNQYKHHTIYFDRKSFGMKAHIMSYNPDVEIKLGYPVLALFNADNTARTYIPVASIPVITCYDKKLISSLASNTEEVYFDFNNATLNQEWIEKNIPDDAIQVVNEALENVYKNNDGKLNLNEALPLILSFNEEYQKEHFNSNVLDQYLPKVERKKHGILCNTAVIYKCSNSRYSRNLIEELEYIKNKATLEELDNSSLSYIYREPVFKNNNDNVTVPLPFIKSNPEQLEAVERAFSNHISKVQGPPGTGKSQVSVNIIANCIYNNKSVLFTSRNKAAISAIVERSNSLLDDNQLVNFCVQEDEAENSWWELDYLDIANRIQSSLPLYNLNNATEFNNAKNILTEIIKQGIEYEQNHIEHLKSEVELSNAIAIYDDVISNYGIKDNLKHDIIAQAEKACLKLSLQNKKGLIGLFYRLKNNKNNSDFENSISSISEYLALLLENKEFSKISVILKEIESKLDSVNKAVKNIKTLKKSKNNENNEYYLKYYDILEKDSKDALFKSIYNNILDVANEIYDEISILSNIMKKDKFYFKRISNIQRENYLEVFKQIHNIQVGWSSTLLSLYRSSPMSSGVFDYVIIDEAAQCDCVSIIPALFRAKNAIIVGDEKQFKPIVNLSLYKENHYWKTYVNDNNLLRFNYLLNSAYSVIGNFPETMLKEHFRCAEGIADYFNEVFYNGELRVRTEENGKLPIPKCLNTNNSFLWHDITTGIDNEIEDAIDTYLKIIKSGFKGSVGIISPLKDIINQVNDKIYAMGYSIELDSIGTAYSFQGGQKDIIIFILGLSDELSRGKKWYLTSAENKNIYNVAVSRAKACFVIVGNKELCRKASLKELRKLADFPKPYIGTIYFDSPLEKKLYEALLNKGIKTQPQYPLFGYFLDLAYQDEFIKIDIEVDGKRYHQNMDGTRVRRDLLRDEQVKKHGWIPLRFWSSEITNNIDYCVERIEAEIMHARNIKY